MKYKVLAIDLDGTLLAKKYKISQDNVQALSKFIDLGGIVCFVTGRSLTSAKNVADKFEVLSHGKKVRYIACLNGTLLYDNWKNEYVEENTLSPEVASKILTICKNNHLSFASYTRNGILQKTMGVYGYKGWTWLINLMNKKTKINYVNKLDDEDVVYKINVLRKMSKAKFTKVEEELKDVCICGLDISKTSHWLYEITKHGANKGNSVIRLSELLNVPLDEFVAFGDSANDISMFKLVGLPIAARQKYKQILPYVKYAMSKPQKNAVARAMNQYVFPYLK
ncbi:HAD family hydrolase [Ureaplasma ceti]|uniref:Sugar-phosphatase n=1 Tax=Ureaplasma ceti TaxID=3119530 RepID=A0ABP9UB11_9BACT